MSRAREFADLAGSADAGGLTGRNMVKNGAMLVSQRGTSFTSSSSAYTLDRFQVFENFGAAFTITQSDTVPDNAQFTKSLKMDCTTAATPSGSNEEFKLVYRMEGYDFLPSGYGNSYAKNLTLSFWVRSNLTGTYRINFMSRSGTNRNIGATYTISSANTWEKKEITFIPDTSVSPYQNHQDAFRIEWYLASSSDRTTGSMPTSWATMDNATRATGLNVNMASSTDNEWYITGVQLEVGEKATPFEHRSFGDELARCQRYYEKSYDYDTATGTAAVYPGNIGLTVRGMDEETSGQRYFTNTMRVEKRADPTNTFYDDAGNSGKVTTFDSGGTPTNNVSIGLVLTQPSMIGCGPGNSAIWGYAYFYESDAEL